MKISSHVSSMMGILFLLAQSAALAQIPQAGDLAPDFKLQDQKGDWHDLQQYRGKWVVLYFYPKDDTPGCTTEACNFRDDIFIFRKMGVTLLGLSTDDIESHRAFSEEFSLPFPLLADIDGETVAKYGSARNLGIMTMAKRHTFIIDPEGRIAKRYDDVDPETHSKEVIGDLKSFIGET